MSGGPGRAGHQAVETDLTRPNLQGSSDLPRPWAEQPAAEAADESLSARAAIDPRWRAVAARWGARALEGCGFFDDGRTPEEWLNLSRDPQGWRPVHQLRPPPAGHVPVVLLATGTLNPVHQGHVSLLRAGAAALRRRGLWVAGGFLAPDHDEYPRTKLGELAMDGETRLRLTEEILQPYAEFAADPWMVRGAGRNTNFTEAALHLEAELRRHFHPDTEVCVVFGEDNADFARAFVEQGRCVVVGRGEARWPEVAGDPHMRQALTRCIWTPELSGELGAISSTSLRRRAAQQPVYALRGDLDWSAQHWSWNWGQGQTCGRVTLPMALREFEAGLLDALKRALPDVAFVVTQQVGGPARAQEIARRLERPVVSMDVSAHGSEPGLNLSSSRVFELGGEQRRGLRPAPRPGHPSLQDQAARITRQLAGRPYVLLDDDVASGQTMTWAQSLLRAAGAVGEARQATLMSRALSDAGYSGAQAMDVCDLRDFLLGSREGGLVVELNGPDALGRAVYAAPWVNLSARASIPQERQHRLSQEIWALNERFHAHSGLQVIDADLACQALLLDQGFGLQAPLAQVAREMRTRCS